MKRIDMQRLLVGLTITTPLSFAAAGGRADTFRVEIDYMGQAPDGHDHQPPQIVIDAVIQMFACQGHTLIIDLDDEVPHLDSLTGDPDNNCANFFSYTGLPNTYRNIRNAYRDRGEGWHYCIFAHQWLKGSPDPDDPETPPGCYETSSSGLANGGDAFVVTLGWWENQTGTLFEQAATLAHELGHNLGLSHCGTCSGGSAYLLNMPSIMTYQYQVVGVRNGMLGLGLMPERALYKEMDYSHGRACALDESSLDEVRGTLMMSVDFNCDNDTNDVIVVQDLNFGGIGMGSNAPWCGEVEEDHNVLTDYNEWANLDDGAALAALGAGGDETALAELTTRRERMVPCITREEADRVLQNMPMATSSIPLEIEPCINGENIYIGDFYLLEAGYCTYPYMTIQGALAAAPDGSVFYITPGDYDEVGITTLDKPAVYTCNTGVATIR